VSHTAWCDAVCPNIVDLDLSSNDITDASALAGLKDLEKLRLTDNAIESLSFATDLPRLTQLLVQGNRLGHMKEISHLAQLQNLRTLYLQNIDGSSPNPVCEHLAYRSGIFRQLEFLTNLDGQRCLDDAETRALKAPIEPVTAPKLAIPEYERWIPNQFWDDVLVKPESVAEPQSVVMESVLKDCHRLDASAQVLLDRCNGFANVKGVVNS